MRRLVIAEEHPAERAEEKKQNGDRCRTVSDSVRIRVSVGDRAGLTVESVSQNPTHGKKKVLIH